jgi:DNA-binding Lrp family transcriptional regulator
MDMHTESTGLTPEQQNELAHALQANVPFDPRPFAAIAREHGLSEADVLRQLRSWASEGKLREVSAILEGSALGYDSALVAGEVSEDRLEAVAEEVNAHPTVTHNYQRNHRYNLWFTIAVPHAMGLERTLDALAARAGVPAFHALRRTHTFKVGVNFDLLSRTSTTAVVPLEAATAFSPSDADQRMFRAIQTPLPIAERPFAELAARFEVSE